MWVRTELSYCISNTCLLLPVHVNFVKEKTEVRKPDIVWKTKEKESERDRKRGGGNVQAVQTHRKRGTIEICKSHKKWRRIIGNIS